MKTLLYRLSIGAGFIATTFLLGRLERGHFAFGAELIVSIVVGAWMIYQITLFCEEVVAMEKQWAKRGEIIKKQSQNIKNQKESLEKQHLFIRCLKETVISQHKEILKHEQKEKQWAQREKFLENKLQNIDHLLAETEKSTEKTEQTDKPSGQPKTGSETKMIAG